MSLFYLLVCAFFSGQEGVNYALQFPHIHQLLEMMKKQFSLFLSLFSLPYKKQKYIIVNNEQNAY